MFARAGLRPASDLFGLGFGQSALRVWAAPGLCRRSSCVSLRLTFRPRPRSGSRAGARRRTRSTVCNQAFFGHPFLSHDFDWRIEIDARSLCQSGAELIAQDASAHLFDLAFAQFAELEWAEGNPDQPVDGQAQMFEDALDLPVLAFAQSHRQPAIGALLAVERSFDPGVANALDGDAFGKAVEDRLIGFAIGAHAVTPEPARGR